MPEHIDLNSTRPDFTALCDWFDQGGDTDSIFCATDHAPDVPLRQPDEPYVEYLPEDFFQKFGFEMGNG